MSLPFECANSTRGLAYSIVACAIEMERNPGGAPSSEIPGRYLILTGPGLSAPKGSLTNNLYKFSKRGILHV